MTGLHDGMNVLRTILIHALDAPMKKIPTTQLTAEELGLPRARFLPTLLTLALIGTAASSATEVTYRYYRFTATKNFNTTTTTSIQLSEFTFGLRGTLLNVNGTTGVGASIPVSASGGTNTATATEGAQKMVDGSVDTKCYNGNRTLPFLFDFGTPVTIDSYNFATANDSNDRTPVTWTLEGSNDNATFAAIDTRADVGITNAYKTYQSGWTVPGGPLPAFTNFSVTAPAVDPAGYGVASPGIVKNGVATNLSWTVAGANAGTVTLNPGAVALADTGSQDFTPPAGTTPYTLSASNAWGTAATTINLRSVAGGSATYLYYRFTPVSLRNNTTSNSIQLGEFEFFNEGNEVAVSQVTNPGGGNPGTEGPANLTDGDPTTKWLDFNKKSVVFEFAEPATIDSYQFVTANDATERDPVRWVIEGSDDQSTWVLVDAVTGVDYPTPTRRATATGQLPLSGRTPAWNGGVNGTWDTSTANFNLVPGSATTTAFADGDAVSFGDGATSTNVVLSAPLSPSHVVFYNETVDYTLSGSPINGPARLVKNGAGTLTLGSANNFNGQIIVNAGTLVSQAAGSMGQRFITAPIELRDGAKLSVPVTQGSGRPLNLASGIGGIVDVPTGITFTHYDKLNTAGTLNKTGAGTLRFENYNGSSSTNTGDDLLIDGGVVEFTASHFNSAPLGGRTFKATVNTGGILRTTSSHALGGDQIDGNTSVEQLRAIGGTLQFNGFTYLPTGLVGAQGRTVLQGGVLEGTAQVENADSFQATAANQMRATITVLPSATSSEIRGTGVLNCNSGHWVFAVENGDAQDDLIISKVVNGTYGIIKEGDGNLVLTNANTYTGSTATTIKLPMPDGTTVRGGTLTARNTTGSATGAGTVLVQAGATLAGTGFITGASNIAGSVSPGEDNTGTLTLGNTVLTGTYLCNLNGTSTDKLVVNGNLDLTGSTLSINPLGAGATESTYVIASYTGTLTGSFTAPITGLPAGYSLFHNEAAKQLELKASAGTDYAAWSAGLSDPSPNADIDHDGLVNGIEYVTGSDPNVPGQGKAPTFTRNASGDLVFTFLRTSASAYLAPGVEYNTSLTGTWTAAPAGQVNVTPNTPEAGVDTVVVTLPAALAQGGRLFARLRVDIP